MCDSTLWTLLVHTALTMSSKLFNVEPIFYTTMRSTCVTCLRGPRRNRKASLQVQQAGQLGALTDLGKLPHAERHRGVNDIFLSRYGPYPFPLERPYHLQKTQVPLTTSRSTLRMAS